MSDMPIHLPPSTTPGTEPSVVCPVWITQSALDGIAMMLAYCTAMEASGKGRVPGSFELTMHYRQLRSAIVDHAQKKK
jgi:hypothetical protein